MIRWWWLLGPVPPSKHFSPYKQAHIMPKPLLSVGELIDQSWDVFRANSQSFLEISAWLLLTAILSAVALAFYPSASDLALNSALTGLETFGVLLFSFTNLLITPLISFLIYIALTRATGAALSRRRFSLRSLLIEIKPLFLPTLSTSIMVMLMILFALVIGFGPAAVVGALGLLTRTSIIVFIANLLLIVGIYYFMAPYLTMLDGTRTKLALATSRQLIEGRFWSVLMRIVVPKLVFVIFGVFLMTIIGYLVGILTDLSAGLNLDTQLRISTMTTTVVPIVIAVLINPLIVISDVLLLRSLRS
jgi:hypothetical protein